MLSDVVALPLKDRDVSAQVENETGSMHMGFAIGDIPPVSGKTKDWSSHFEPPVSRPTDLELLTSSNDYSFHVQFDDYNATAAKDNWGNALVGYFIDNANAKGDAALGLSSHHSDHQNSGEEWNIVKGKHSGFRSTSPSGDRTLPAPTGSAKEKAPTETSIPNRFLSLSNLEGDSSASVDDIAHTTTIVMGSGAVPLANCNSTTGTSQEKNIVSIHQLDRGTLPKMGRINQILHVEREQGSLLADEAIAAMEIRRSDVLSESTGDPALVQNLSATGPHVFHEQGSKGSAKRQHKRFTVCAGQECTTSETCATREYAT
ncbi:hypothetical protein MRB53_030559 [Persea americana]|uniref:Uncharacterized protein n=1 Tax=Persea americana TaxID=3435 RepID=A0ACC2KM03_PERAE|nr:hypothetical protein MRB53_030559 [Persea americana]